MPVGANLVCYNFAMNLDLNLTINDEMIISALAEKGYVVIDQFLSETTVATLAKVASTKFSNHEMNQARTGKNAQAHTHIRGDSIHWLDENSPEQAVQEYFSAMHHLKTSMNQQLFMGLAFLETHLAIYPVGAVYQKHLDQFSVTQANQLNTRKVSSILYLNEDWQPENGGELRLYLNDAEWMDILPNAGRLVLFLSSDFWHEVLPANRERLSLTGWFRTREPQPI
jgi:SM-20-related protein